MDKKEEERRKLVEDDTRLTLTGGIDAELFTRQEAVFFVDRSSHFLRLRAQRPSRDISTNPTVALSASNVLSQKIFRLLEVSHIPLAERKIEEQRITCWVSDVDAPLCMNCGLKWGLDSALVLARRHHCRVCGAVICSETGSIY